MSKTHSFRTASVIHKKYGISRASLRRWSDKNIIRCIRCGQGGKRLYHFQDVQRYLGVESSKDDKKTEKIIYCRVSSAHQKEDLQRQIDDLSRKYPEHTVISDIGSGLDKVSNLW
jgi:predicted site-specific integrase-resolvase